MSFKVEVFAPDEWAEQAAAHVGGVLPRDGVVIVTGGGTARSLYPHLAARADNWSEIDVFFSDERCVPPDHPHSNYRVVRERLLHEVGPRTVHRMRGEDHPPAAAAAYDKDIRAAMERRPDLLLLGMGDDCHVAGLFAHSPALEERQRLCAAVNRPDGMQGLTLTAPALTSARRVLLIVTGAVKAGAVERALKGNESPTTCPVRLFADHRAATFLIDHEGAADL
ncbi:MAG: 6-phosphogluconolactonase [Actinomycetota bacterium]|nr:6-phosphogluconolactonase [Actinomycetota bacterium]